MKRRLLAVAVLAFTLPNLRPPILLAGDEARPTPRPKELAPTIRSVRGTPTPRATRKPRALATIDPDERPPAIISPTQGQVIPAGSQLLIKIEPVPGSNATKFDVELQKKMGGVWQAWTNLTYNSQTNPNGVYQQTGTQNPDRRLRAKSQGVPNAQWTTWVLFKLQ